MKTTALNAGDITKIMEILEKTLPIKKMNGENTRKETTH